jgi:hypothetical protein
MLSLSLHTTYHLGDVSRNHISHLNESLVFKALESSHLNVIRIDPLTSFR